MTNRIVGYARVSKREQAENSNALEQQIDRLKRAELAEIGRQPAFWQDTLTTEEKLILYPHYVETIWVRDRKGDRVWTYVFECAQPLPPLIKKGYGVGKLRGHGTGSMYSGGRNTNPPLFK